MVYQYHTSYTIYITGTYYRYINIGLWFCIRLCWWGRDRAMARSGRRRRHLPAATSRKYYFTAVYLYSPQNLCSAACCVLALDTSTRPCFCSCCVLALEGPLPACTMLVVYCHRMLLPTAVKHEDEKSTLSTTGIPGMILVRTSCEDHVCDMSRTHGNG